MSKLVIIDGHAILYRAFHAMPPLTTRSGEPINAVYGLVSMILRLVQDLKPTAITVAFDETAPTFRKKELPTYQSQRPPMPDDLSSQFEKAKEFLKASGIPFYSKPGYEADDVIGTIADKAGGEVIIVTGDRDQLQLVDDKKNIKLYMPIAGLSNAKLFGEKETTERMGVPPSQIADLKALIGDPSDNYHGVVGIGPKTAEKLLKEYNNIKNIFTHLKDIEPKVREKLETGKDDANLSFKLATIVRDVPVKVNFDEMKKWKLDSKEVLNLFENFGFKTLTNRIKVVGKKIEEEKQESLF